MFAPIFWVLSGSSGSGAGRPQRQPEPFGLPFPERFTYNDMGMHKVIAVVGMAGSGKSEAARVFETSGFARVRFGDITDMELQKRSLARNEENERRVRESLRQQYGMAAYARLNLPRMDSARAISNVVADGLYSWEEYIFLKDYYRDSFLVLAVWASPATRYQRLGRRAVRPLSLEEARSRDQSEIENVNKGGPIAMADFTIANECALGEFKKDVQRLVDELKCPR